MMDYAVRALAYETWTRRSASKTIEEEVAKDRDVRRLGSFFEIEEEWVKRLDEVIMSRPESKVRDLAKLYEVLEHARNPSSFLVAMIDKIENGLFTTNFKTDERIDRLVEAFHLDDEVRWRLVELRVRRGENTATDHQRLEQHLRHCEDTSLTALSLIKKVVQGRLNDIPDLSECDQLMVRFSLIEAARWKLRYIIEKRAEEEQEGAMLLHIQEILSVSYNPSAKLLELADQLAQGATLSHIDLKLIEKQSRQAKKMMSKKAARTAKRKASSSSDSSSNADSDSPSSSTSSSASDKKTKKRKKGQKTKKKKKNKGKTNGAKQKKRKKKKAK